MSVESILAELVALDTRSSVSNAAFVSHVAPRVEALGFGVRLLAYADERGVEKTQLVAVHPKTFEGGGEVELALVGHTDTVTEPQFPFIFSLSLTSEPAKSTIFQPSFTQDSHKLVSVN